LGSSELASRSPRAIAGGYGPDKLRMDEGLLGLVRALDEQAKPIAFICHGVWVAASAGIVAGRRVTGNPAIEVAAHAPAPA
jgi:protease I